MCSLSDCVLTYITGSAQERKAIQNYYRDAQALERMIRREKQLKEKQRPLRTAKVGEREKCRVIKDFLRNIGTQVKFVRKSPAVHGSKYNFALEDNKFKSEGILRWCPVHIHVRQVVADGDGLEVYENREWTNIHFTELKRNNDFTMILLCDEASTLLRIIFVPYSKWHGCTTLTIYNSSFIGRRPKKIKEKSWKNISFFAFPEEGGAEHDNLRARKFYGDLAVVDGHSGDYTKYYVDSVDTSMRGTFEEKLKEN